MTWCLNNVTIDPVTHKHISEWSNEPNELQLLSHFIYRLIKAQRGKGKRAVSDQTFIQLNKTYMNQNKVGFDCSQQIH